METTSQAKESGFDAFFTRKRANEGIELPLSLPDGTPTKHSLRVRSLDSDEFRRANLAAQRIAVELAASDMPEARRLAELEKAKTELIASLIVSWTFEQEFTRANVITFLTEAPQVADEINSIAAKRSLFYKAASTASTPTPAQNSS